MSNQLLSEVYGDYRPIHGLAIVAEQVKRPDNSECMRKVYGCGRWNDRVCNPGGGSNQEKFTQSSQREDAESAEEVSEVQDSGKVIQLPNSWNQ